MNILRKLPVSRVGILSVVVVTTIIGACSSTPATRLPRTVSSSAGQDIVALSQRIDELTRQLEAARAEASSARNLAENAQATADAAQIMAASTDDRIQEMFDKSIFK